MQLPFDKRSRAQVPYRCHGRRCQWIMMPIGVVHVNVAARISLSGARANAHIEPARGLLVYAWTGALIFPKGVRAKSNQRNHMCNMLLLLFLAIPLSFTPKLPLHCTYVYCALHIFHCCFLPQAAVDSRYCRRRQRAAMSG